MDAKAYSQSLEAEVHILREQLAHDQDQLKQIGELLNTIQVPTNGEGGEGKREEFSTVQRVTMVVELVKDVIDPGVIEVDWQVK